MTTGSAVVDQAIRLQRAIREALLKEWDPIGVKDIPEARDEYSGYVGPVYELLRSGATEKEVFEYLWWTETDQMGLLGDRSATERFAHRLLEIKATMDQSEQR
jgi:hypothetical protein